MDKCIAEYLGEYFDNSDISDLLEGNLGMIKYNFKYSLWE